MPLYDKSRKKKIYPFVRKKADGDRLKTMYSFYRQHPVMIATAIEPGPPPGTPPSFFSMRIGVVDPAGSVERDFIYGLNFESGATVTVRNFMTDALVANVDDVTYHNPRCLSVLFPPLALGFYFLRVTNPDGQYAADRKSVV